MSFLTTKEQIAFRKLWRQPLERKTFEEVEAALTRYANGPILAQRREDIRNLDRSEENRDIFFAFDKAEFRRQVIHDMLYEKGGGKSAMLSRRNLDYATANVPSVMNFHLLLVEEAFEFIDAKVACEEKLKTCKRIHAITGKGSDDHSGLSRMNKQFREFYGKKYKVGPLMEERMNADGQMESYKNEGILVIPLVEPNEDA